MSNAAVGSEESKSGDGPIQAGRFACLHLRTERGAARLEDMAMERALLVECSWVHVYPSSWWHTHHGPDTQLAETLMLVEMYNSGATEAQGPARLAQMALASMNVATELVNNEKALKDRKHFNSQKVIDYSTK